MFRGFNLWKGRNYGRRGLRRKMRGIVCKGEGPPSVMEIGDLEFPVCNQHQCLIKMEATSVNRADILQRKGLYPPPVGESNILGLECAGYLINDIKELNSEAYKTNPRVMAILPSGGYAEYAKINKKLIIPIPDNLSFLQGGGISEVWLTSYQILRFVGNMKVNEYVLIHAGASGVGASAIQLVNYFGGKSIAIVSGDAKQEFCTKLGAHYTINRHTHNLPAEVMKITNNKGADFIMDCVGAQEFKNNLSCIAPFGRWVIYGFLGGAKLGELDMGKLLYKKVNMNFTTLRYRPQEYLQNLVSSFNTEILHQFGNKGIFLPIVDKVFKISQVQQAHQYVSKNLNMGKVILINDF